MQTNGLLLASGMPRLVCRIPAIRWTVNKGTKCPRPPLSASRLPPRLFSRLMAIVDRLLMASARVAIRNGDLPYFGL